MGQRGIQTADNPFVVDPFGHEPSTGGSVLETSPYGPVVAEAEIPIWLRLAQVKSLGEFMARKEIVVVPRAFAARMFVCVNVVATSGSVVVAPTMLEWLAVRSIQGKKIDQAKRREPIEDRSVTLTLIGIALCTDVEVSA